MFLIGFPFSGVHHLTTVLKQNKETQKDFGFFVAVVRSLPDCMATAVLEATPNDVPLFVETSPVNDELKSAYQLIASRFQEAPDKFVFIDYDDLVVKPLAQLRRIHAACGLPDFKYDLSKVTFAPAPDAKKLLGAYYSRYCQPEFWHDKQKAIPVEDDLDRQLKASIRGDVELGRRIANELAVSRPYDSRAAFNRGWYELREGKIQEGYALMHRGRRIGVFGDKPIETDAPLWSVESKDVLLQLEGGLGDQIHQIRYAELLARRGSRVVVSCSKPLKSLFAGVSGVSAIVEHGAEPAVYHDSWMPGMSAPMFLGLDLADLSGKPYLHCPKVKKGDRLRIGLRWSGNKAFEAEHHKLFPADLFFDAVKRDDVEFVSLQRDADLQFKPDWVKDVKLETWQDTRDAVASCDLVISSCTSVSHLSAAMGVKTWVIIPIMAYYLYAMPGPNTPYYDCMTLFRQKVYGNWEHPMNEVKQALSALR